MAISVVTSLVVLAVVALWRDPVSQLLGAEQLAPWLWLVPPSLLATGLFQSFSYWCIRTSSFGSLSVSRVMQALGRVGTQIGTGAGLAAGPSGLIGGYLAGQTLAAVLLGVPVLGRTWPGIRDGASVDGIRAQAARYRKFPLFTMPNAWLNAASQHMPAFLLPVTFGTGVLGQYYLAQRLFTIPTAFFRQALHEVFYREATQCHRAGRGLTALVLRTYGRLALIVVLPSVALWILAPDIFALVFGESWRQSGHYLRLILPWLALMAVVSPSTVILPVLNRQEVGTVYEVALITARTLALVAGAQHFESACWAIGLYGAVGVVANLVLAFMIVSLCRRSDAGRKR
jgi:O-antigen/teichoic acid export membrane protein